VHSHPKEADLRALLAELCNASVEFIIVGGTAAVLQGAPISTNDLDIVHRRTPENVARLLEVLLQLDATMRYDFARRGLRPTAEMLAGTGQINLSTSLGPLDPFASWTWVKAMTNCSRIPGWRSTRGSICACSICRR